MSMNKLPPVVNVDGYNALVWQAECHDTFKSKIDSALKKHGKDFRTDFLLDAFPNSGKTTFSFLAMRSAKEKYGVELNIICVPNNNIKNQWAKASSYYGIHLSQEFTNRRLSKRQKFDPQLYGIICTYAQVAQCPELFRAYSSKYTTMAIFDEVHHLGDEKTWGEKARFAFELSNITLSLSGTPFRPDGDDIPFQTYEYDNEGAGGKKVIPDYRYSYKRAIREGKSRPLEFSFIDGDQTWDNGEKTITASFGDTLPEKERGHRLRTALAPNSQSLIEMVRAGLSRLRELRKTEQPNAKMLIIASDKNQAINLKKRYLAIEGKEPIVVTEDVKGSADIIEAFKTNNEECIISIKMLAEGCDIPSARVLVYATNITEQRSFNQIVTRVIRKEGFHQKGPGYVYLHKAPENFKNAKKIEDATFVTIAQPEPAPSARVNVSSGNVTHFQPISSIKTAEIGFFRGEMATEAELSLARKWKADNPEKANQIYISEVELGMILSTNENSPPIQVENKIKNIETYDEKKSRLGNRCQKKASHLAQLRDIEVKAVHAEWIRQGGPRHEEATIEDLISKDNWLNERISASLAQNPFEGVTV